MVVFTHLIVHFKKINFMTMVKEVLVHQILGIFFLLLASLFVVVSSVGIVGEFVQLKQRLLPGTGLLN